MQKSHTTPLAKNDLKQFSIRIGKIFSNISIIALLLCFSGMLSLVATAFIILIGLVVIFATVGTIFIIIPNYFNSLMSATQISAEISLFFLDNFYIFASIALLGAIVSLVLLALDKHTKHTARIVVSSIVIIIALVAIIVMASGVIK